MAGGRDRFLVTWHETSPDGDTDLFAQRYRPDGTREGSAIAVSAARGDQRCPTAAWNGSSWLVVWTDRRAGDPDVFGAFVSSSGVVSPGAGFAISTTSSAQDQPGRHRGRDQVGRGVDGSAERERGHLRGRG